MLYPTLLSLNLPEGTKKGYETAYYCKALYKIYPEGPRRFTRYLN
jgi:hypothetical protein